MGDIKFNKFMGIKDAVDVLATRQPYLRTSDNVDIDDDGALVSRRQGFGPPIISGAYHSLWSNRAETLMLGVVGTQLAIADPENLLAPTRIVRSGLTAGLHMEYVEINDRVYYTNSQVLGFIDSGMDGPFPALTKFGASRMPAGHLIEYYEERLYTVLGGQVAPSAPLDFGRASLRKDFLWFAGQMTMFKAVKDGIYVSYGNTTAFLSGRRPAEFIVQPVADYPALPYTAFTFDASLASDKAPLQGPAVYWMSTQGPCIGLAGGQMLNLALTKVVPIEATAGASILRKNRKGFMQAVSILQN